MKQKLDEKARVFAPVRNGKVAGAIPAESKTFPSRDSGDKSEAGLGAITV